MTDIDLAVAWGRGAWPGLVAEPLLRVEGTPVLSPALLGAEVTEPSDLLDLPLMHHRDTTGWRRWFEEAGIEPPLDLPGTLFDDANILLQAAVAGRGAILGMLGLIGDDLAAGRLVQPFAISVEPEDAYYLVSKPAALASDAVSAVRTWMLRAIED